MNPVTDQMTIKEDNLSILEVELPAKAEEENLITAVLQDIIIEVILERDLRIWIDLEIDPGRILRNHIMDPESHLRNVIDPGMCHHSPRTLIIISLGIRFPDTIEIHLINQEDQVLILDQGETIVVFSVSIVWDMGI